jgi:hypothetical protein
MATPESVFREYVQILLQLEPYPYEEKNMVSVSYHGKDKIEPELFQVSFYDDDSLALRWFPMNKHFDFREEILTIEKYKNHNFPLMPGNIDNISLLYGPNSIVETTWS